ncbi:helix-turn-helix domain-containing protein, partial [Chitinophaga sp. 30R24]|uniref:helix-turn-helix domain-containing protein n=1 Tax=Chitinophaga sp. 30R24 TaxID=3248838 RepID=UPI003B8EDBFC
MKTEIKEYKRVRHAGKNLQRIRVYLGVKQETLAAALNLNQQDISKMEQQENIEEDKLERAAAALGVSPDMIREFDESNAIYNINNIRDNTFSDNSTSIAQQFNPIEKIVELYERLLQSEREKVELLKKNN